MKKQSLLLIAFFTCIGTTYGQERIFSLGYGKTFVKEDSSTVSIIFDLNRIPGQSEKAGGYYFLNEVIKKSRWGYFIKPTMDVNIGSAIASAPNNISIGLPIGVVYDFKKNSIGIFSWYFDCSPEVVADKVFTNNLYYFSLNTYLKYEFLDNRILLNVIAGISNANGARNQILPKGDETDKYGRLTIPLYLKLVAWNASTRRIVNGVQKGKDFKRISWISSLKFNHIYSDNKAVNKETNYTFFNSKLDFYIAPNFGINVTYFNGNEEPIFKRNNSITFGLTLAR